MNHLERALDQQNQFWKYLVNILASFVASGTIGSLPLVLVITYKTAKNAGATQPISHNLADLSVYGISPNLGLFLMMLPFVLSLLTMIYLLQPLHNRSFAEVVNGTKKIRWNRFFYAAGIWAILMFVYLIVDYSIDPSNYIFQFDFSNFIVLMFISLLLIPFQTTFEELMIRGYLGQAIGAWTKNRWLVILIPSIIFALLHSANPEVKEFGFWSVMPQYLIFGLIFGLITILSDGIELSMGIHAANNIFLSLVITNSSSVLQTPAVFNQQIIHPTKETLILTALGIIMVILLSKKYKFDFSVLNKKIQKEAVELESELNQQEL